MKTISAGMATHLLQETTSLATCWRLSRTDGVEFFFTDHDRAIIFEGNTYAAKSAYTRTAIANTSTLSVDNLDIQGIFDSDQITEQDLRAGLFDFAQVRIFMVNYENLLDSDIKMRNGRLGEVALTVQGTFKAELRGLTEALSQQIGELYQPECRADLGDARCVVPIKPDLRADNFTFAERAGYVRVATAAGVGQEQFENRIYEVRIAGTTAGTEPTFDTTVGATTIDGTVTFQATEAWTRSATISTVTDAKNFTIAIDEPRAVDGWFNGGALIFDDGENTGRVIEIRNQVGVGIELFLGAAFPITVGTKIAIYPGCDKRLTTCINKFQLDNTLNLFAGNAKNFRGEPFVPGQDVLLRYPDAKF